MKALKCNPVGELVRLAQATDIDPAIRARCYIEMLAYLYPKRKAIEITEIEQPELVDKPDLSYLTDEELETLENIMRAGEERAQ